MKRILIDDGSRHTRLTGYGHLSRAIISALSEHTDVELTLRNRDGAVPDWVRQREEIECIPVDASEQAYDGVLHVTSPNRKIRENFPSAIYTQHALSQLVPSWIDGLRGVDQVIVPGEFDARVFRPHFDSVHTCHQFVDGDVFKPRPSYRAEGPEEFSFLFVGSFSYRKGLDLLLRAYSKAFDRGQNVNLTLHCFSGFEGGRVDDVVKIARKLPDNLKLSVYNGSVTPDWMARIYNRHDAVISLSRGEGWCMPLYEGLLCGKPVIASDSTAMGECLPDIGTAKVQTRERSIATIRQEFGLGFKQRYGFPGNMMYEPDIDAAVEAMNDVYENYKRYEKGAKIARSKIIQKYSKRSMAEKIMNAMQNLT